MSMKAEKEIVTTVHRIDKTVVRMDQKLTDHLDNSVKNEGIINDRIKALNVRVDKNTKFINKLRGMGAFGAILLTVGTMLIIVYQVFSGRKN